MNDNTSFVDIFPILVNQKKSWALDTNLHDVHHIIILPEAPCQVQILAIQHEKAEWWAGSVTII